MLAQARVVKQGTLPGRFHGALIEDEWSKVGVPGSWTDWSTVLRVFASPGPWTDWTTVL